MFYESALLKRFFIAIPTDDLAEPISVSSQFFLPLQFRRKLLAAKLVAWQIRAEAGLFAARAGNEQDIDFPNRQHLFRLGDDLV